MGRGTRQRRGARARNGVAPQRHRDGASESASLWLAAGVMALRQSMETRSGTGQGRDAARPGAKHDSAVARRGRRPV
ncbi:hypothetical protein [Erwinia mallotivora]|uniref:hypothetical protein n=1 Tax=Erwinia mallotivora TaxID=69222 RepID=UPI0021BF7323|nr:hypothetical protein [Erwinia mallotivora]